MTWELDDTGDIILEDTGFGAVRIKTSEDASDRLRELARIRLLTTFGEDLFAQDMGLPYPSVIGIYDRSFIETEIRRTLLADPEIEEVVDLIVDLLDPVKRRVSVYIRLRGVEGSLAVLEGGIT